MSGAVRDELHAEAAGGPRRECAPREAAGPGDWSEAIRLARAAQERAIDEMEALMGTGGWQEPPCTVPVRRVRWADEEAPMLDEEERAPAHEAAEVQNEPLPAASAAGGEDQCGRGWAARSARTLARRLRRQRRTERGCSLASALSYRAKCMREALAEHWRLSA